MVMTSSERERVDVIIVGAGAAGSLFAQRFARAGRRVRVIESGPRWERNDLASSGIWSRQLKPAESGVAEVAGDRLFATYHQGSGTGGAALHQGAVWIRLREEDFQTRSRFGWGFDWPIEYDDLRPFYDRFQEEAGISGDAEREIWRPPGAPYPLPPLPWTRQADVLATGFAAFGLPVAPIPLGIISQPYRGRAACQHDGWCEAGCPVGALANPLTLHLGDAVAHRADLQTGRSVIRLIPTNDGRRIDAVESIDRSGHVRRDHADLVILAASAIQNVRLLLASTSLHHPDGIGNRQGQVGKGFMVHPVQTIFGLHADETDPTFGYNGGCLLNQSDYTKADRGSSYQWLGAPSMKLNDLLGIAPVRPHLYGETLHRFMQEAAHHLVSLTALGEDRASDENRISLSHRRDTFGLPLATVTHSLHPTDRQTMEIASEHGTRIMRATGAREVWRGEPWHFHLLGGTRMGSDPATSVTDSFGRCHDMPNLWIAGGGLFPTVGAINPTLTLYALADRTASSVLS